MAYKDLRAFLQRLKEEGQFVHVEQQVNLEPDLGACGRAVTSIGDNPPALLFDNLFGYEQGKRAVALNVIGSWANHALMLGLPKDTPVKEQFVEFSRRWDKFPIPVKEMKDAPFYKNEVTKDINLFDILPFFRLNDHDGGFYIDKACVISKDPVDPDNFGKQNVGVYRLQVKGKDHLGIQPVPMHDIAVQLRMAEERGQNLPVAIAIGNDPVILIMASSPLLYDQSEYEMAGAIQEEPYPVVKGKLTGLDIPWGAEVVLEGEIIGRKREPEGPFGEFTGSYSGGRSMPVVKIKAVYHRTNPIFEALYLGIPWTELDYMIGLNTCLPLYKQLKETFPEVVAVNAMYTHGLVAIISTKTRYGGFAKARSDYERSLRPMAWDIVRWSLSWMRMLIRLISIKSCGRSPRVSRPAKIWSLCPMSRSCRCIQPLSRRASPTKSSSTPLSRLLPISVANSLNPWTRRLQPPSGKKPCANL